MDSKIILASFALVFLAELGDKTQLAALAFTTRFNSPWAVFIGTSLALISTTAIAVLFGGLLAQKVPIRALQIASAAMFIIIGLLLLINLARHVPTEDSAKENSAPVERPHGAVFNLIVNQSLALEEHVINYLEGLAANLEPGHAKDTLITIAQEDNRHMTSLRDLQHSHEGEATHHQENMTHAELADIKMRISCLDNASGTICCQDAHAPRKHDEIADNREIILRAIAVEEEFADYYLAMARSSKIHDVRDAFRWLAMEELRHAQTLCSLINPDSPSKTSSFISSSVA